MPVRFRRTIKIFPGVKVNVSKGGISFTVGTKGYHLNFSKRGVKQTVGLPGSGLSHSTYLVENDPKDETENGKEKENQQTDDDEKERTSHDDSEPIEASPRRRTPGWVLLLGLVVIYAGATVLGLIPTNFLSQILRTLLEWTRSVGL